MPQDFQITGTQGERRAREYLAGKGYALLAQNFRMRGAEIDLIAQDEETIVFIEVKTRSGAHSVPGREAVTAAKQRRICQGALYYLMKNGLMNRQARFDVIEIQGERVTHIVNAFLYQGPSF